ncbi:MAG: anthranilate synthase component I family protein [Gemmatimonas sp.]|uniref:anthranilate synthase component I family protein n=1 Tax=Gemmatimonas sp. TaxID=1962908 RepID=UPI00391F0366
MTSLAAFRARAAVCRTSGGLVPVWRDCLLDLCTPVSAFAKLRRGPFAFLLESAITRGEAWSRYTYLGTEPRGAWRLTDGVVEDWTRTDGWHGARTPDDPIADLRDLLRAMKPVEAPELGALWSGAFGFFGYDVVRHIERLPHAPPRALAYPDACFVFTDALVVIDNWRGQARVIVSVPVPANTTDAELDALHERASHTLEHTIARLQGPDVLPPLDLAEDAPPAMARSTYPREAFLRDVQRIKDYILSGDVFQTLLARRMAVPHDFDSTTLYRALRALNPSPYMFHLQLDGLELVGSSPELMVRVADGRVTVRPIAGTRPRGRTPEQDAALAAELVADEKERAEHVMLVDLGRNDVGRLAKSGTVAVTDLMVVEQYSHVFHLVSQVEGELADGSSALDAFRAVFPAGTMTGAPKVRAMEIIDELEPERRGAYAGALGVIGAGDTRMDLAITIRTCVIADGVASVQAGAGIVHDSVAEKEWVESDNKARAMLTAIGRARAASPRPVGSTTP